MFILITFIKHEKNSFFRAWLKSIFSQKLYNCKDRSKLVKGFFDEQNFKPKVQKKRTWKKSQLPLTEWDRQQGRELRSILVKYGSDLTLSVSKKYNKRKKQNITRQVSPETLAENIYCIRTQKNAKKREITRVLHFIEKNWFDQYTPRIYNSWDFYNKWERFRDAARKEHIHKNSGVGKTNLRHQLEKASKLALEEYLDEKCNRKRRTKEDGDTTHSNGVFPEEVLAGSFSHVDEST